MFARVSSGALTGLNAVPVDVEVEIGNANKDYFNIVGLGDNAVRESRERIVATIKRSGFRVPTRVLVNLAPAELKKEGSAFDLSMAVGVLIASGQIGIEYRRRLALFGELSLDGGVKSIRGVLALTIGALEAGMDAVIVPYGNLPEASLVTGIEVIGVRSFGEVVALLSEGLLPDTKIVKSSALSSHPRRSISDVRGQQVAKRALLIAATGGHNTILIGPPGCGKSMLAERFSTMLPPLLQEEMLEVVKIHSIAGLSVEHILNGVRPFRTPHHVASDVALIGGGVHPRPGEITLAHRGVLFLDEFPEYRRSALEALRGPLESGVVQVSRARGTVVFPAMFQLIAAMNPCPCGRLGSRDQGCICSRAMLDLYMRRLSRPILERIDLHVELDAVPFEEMTSRDSPETRVECVDYGDSVNHLRQFQHQRRGVLNSRLELDLLLGEERVKASALKLLEHASKKGMLSARSFVRVLRVARTIADLEGVEVISDGHVAEALSYRVLDRRLGVKSGSDSGSSNLRESGQRSFNPIKSPV